MNTKNILFFLASLMLGKAPALANEIVCREANSNQIAMQFHSNNPIPDYNFERFQVHSSYGDVSIHGKEYGPTWMTIKNAGFELSYEIKLQNASSQPIASIHLTLSKVGVFNGYQQYNGVSSGKQEMELLNCNFENLN